MEKVCLQGHPGADENDRVLINMLKPVVLATSDKIAIVVHTGLDFCANVLWQRLGDMKRFGLGKLLLDE